MGNDIIIGKARVIGVEEVSLDSQPKGGALSGVQTAPAKKQSMVVSPLLEVQPMISAVALASSKPALVLQQSVH